MNNIKNDIKFLEEFRNNIDKYLFLGFAPSYGSPGHDSASSIVDEKLKDLDYANLRKIVSEQKPRAVKITSDLGLSSYMTQHPPPFLSGTAPIIKQHLFDIVTDNRTWQRVGKQTVLDLIDNAIGSLKENINLTQKGSIKARSNNAITEDEIKKLTISGLISRLSVGAWLRLIILLCVIFTWGYNLGYKNAENKLSGEFKVSHIIPSSASNLKQLPMK